MDFGFIQHVNHIFGVIQFRWLASKIRFVRSSVFARQIMTKCILCRALPWTCHPSVAFVSGTTVLWNLWNASNFYVCETGGSKLSTLDPSQIHITKWNWSKFTLILLDHYWSSKWCFSVYCIFHMTWYLGHCNLIHITKYLEVLCVHFSPLLSCTLVQQNGFPILVQVNLHKMYVIHCLVHICLNQCYFVK